jgi:hypothetical protein
MTFGLPTSVIQEFRLKIARIVVPGDPELSSLLKGFIRIWTN